MAREIVSDKPGDAAKPQLLFVYGTLRRQSDHPMSRFLAAHASFLGMATTAGNLYDLGNYPGFKPGSAPGDWVHGDVYRIEDSGATLRLLDAYEGCGPRDGRPFLFGRELRHVILEGGDVARAWVYVYNGVPADTTRISSGDYFQR
jgi:gamma-glutamylcyclotransferase (GGCT)/AIG2-like uncharacterized protein YtfP